jgi:hypothetical protein
MNRLIATMAALLVSTASYAELSSLAVQLTPEASHYTQGDTIRVVADGNGTGMEYRFLLERASAGFTRVIATDWGTANSLDLVTGTTVTPAGQYRLSILSREAGKPQEGLTKYKSFKLRSRAAVDLSQMATVDARFDKAAQRIRDLYSTVVYRERLGIDLTGLCEHAIGEQELIREILNAEDKPAPGGGNAFVTGAANAETGAIGVEGSACMDPLNWNGVSFTLHRPAFQDLEALSLTLDYTALYPPEERQRQMSVVQARFEQGVRTLRQHFAEIKAAQALGAATRLDSYCDGLGSSLAVIANTLNPEGRSAPRGGNAYEEGSGNAQSGALGVETVSACTDPDNFSGVAFRIHQPAFLDLSPRSVTFNFAD